MLFWNTSSAAVLIFRRLLMDCLYFFSDSVKVLKLDLSAHRLLCRTPDLTWIPAAAAVCQPIHLHWTRLHHPPCLLITRPSCSMKPPHQWRLKFILMFSYVLGKSLEGPAFSSSYNSAWISNAREVWFWWPWRISYLHTSPFPPSLCASVVRLCSVSHTSQAGNIWLYFENACNMLHAFWDILLLST